MGCEFESSPDPIQPALTFVKGESLKSNPITLWSLRTVYSISVIWYVSNMGCQAVPRGRLPMGATPPRWRHPRQGQLCHPGYPKPRLLCPLLPQLSHCHVRIVSWGHCCHQTTSRQDGHLTAVWLWQAVPVPGGLSVQTGPGTGGLSLHHHPALGLWQLTGQAAVSSDQPTVPNNANTTIISHFSPPYPSPALGEWSHSRSEDWRIDSLLAGCYWIQLVYSPLYVCMFI